MDQVRAMWYLVSGIVLVPTVNPLCYPLSSTLFKPSGQCQVGLSGSVEGLDWREWLYLVRAVEAGRYGG